MPRRMKDMEPQATGGAIWTAGEAASAETRRAVKEHGGFAPFHEGYGVLQEEVEELWAEIKINSDSRSRRRIRAEAIQVAAMAIEIAAIASMEREDTDDNQD